MISDKTVLIGYIKVTDVPSETNEIATSSISSNTFCPENMVNNDYVNAEVEFTHITMRANREKHKN